MFIDINEYPCLANLLTLADIIDPETTVENLDSGEKMNLVDIINKAKEELL